MKSFLSDYLIIFQNLTLPGFLYLLGVLFLIQARTTIKIDKIIEKENKELYPYIIILIIVLSFIIGLIAHLAEKEIFSFFKLNNAINNKLKCSNDQEYSDNVYGVQILIRHLIFSISFLVFSIAIYFKKEGKKITQKWFFIIMYLILFSVLTLAYLKIKDILDQLRKGKPNSKLFIISAVIILFSISLVSICTVNCRNKKQKLGIL